MLGGASLLLAALAGCIEWDEQEIRFAYDSKRDRLDVQLVYLGVGYGDAIALFGRGGPDVERTDALLERLRAGRPLFALLSSWPLGFDLDAARDAAREPEHADPALEALLGHVAVDHGDFFRTADGRLCFWQRLRIERFTAFLEVANSILTRELADAKARKELREGFRLSERASDARVLRWVKRGWPWLRLHGSAITFTVPAGEQDARRLADRTQELFGGERAAERIGAAIERHAEQQDGKAEFARRFLAIDLRAERTAEGVELVLGDPEREVQLVRYDARDDGRRKYDLAPLLEERGIAIRTDVTDATLRAEFAFFRRY